MSIRWLLGESTFSGHQHETHLDNPVVYCEHCGKFWVHYAPWTCDCGRVLKKQLYVTYVGDDPDKVIDEAGRELPALTEKLRWLRSLGFHVP